MLNRITGPVRHPLGALRPGPPRVPGRTRGDALALRASPGTARFAKVAVADAPAIPGLRKSKGPSSATDNAAARYDGTTGKLQNSGVIIDDSNNVSGVVNQTQSGYTELDEIAAPSSPAANKLRVYAKDNGSGVTKAYIKDSAGTETELGAGGGGGSLTRGTAVASTSGTEIDFTSLPAGITRITIMFDGVSLSGTDEFAVQIGDSGGFETTGYSSAAIGTSSGGNGIITSTTAFCARAGNASRAMSGMMTLVNITGNVWVENHVMGSEAQTSVSYGGGRKELSATLDRVRITRSGTNTFDAGQINILYE